MMITSIKIHNYRSIHDLEMHCEPLVVMLGPNNHGKSNILSALDFFLSTSAKPSEEDFFSYRGDDNELWVELTFHGITEQERTTFKKYLRSDDSICVRKTAKLTEGTKVETFYNGYVEEPEERWLQSDAVEHLTKREEVKDTPLSNLMPEKGRLTKSLIQEAQQKYIDEHRSELTFSEAIETGPFLGQKNVGGGVLPDLYLIPAVRDLSDETKIKSGTVFGKLLNRAIQEMAMRDPRFKDVREKRFHMSRWINPDRGEMFFARKVANVAGETESTILPFLAQKIRCFDADVSVIDCGSKHNLLLYITIANAFRLSYVVVHDEDPLPDPTPTDWNADKLRNKRHTFKLNKEIENTIVASIGSVEMFSPRFEDVAEVSKAQGEKKGKALAALDHFEDKAIDEIPDRLKTVVESVYGSETE